jgi:hypothetical protein
MWKRERCPARTISLLPLIEEKPAVFSNRVANAVTNGKDQEDTLNGLA